MWVGGGRWGTPRLVSSQLKVLASLAFPPPPPPQILSLGPQNIRNLPTPMNRVVFMRGVLVQKMIGPAHPLGGPPDTQLDWTTEPVIFRFNLSTK